MRELRSFWRDVILPLREDEAYLLPKRSKDDDPYAYYGVYSIRDNGSIWDLDDWRKNQTYSSATLDAFKYEFAGPQLKMYKAMHDRVNTWRKTRDAKKGS